MLLLSDIKPLDYPKNHRIYQSDYLSGFCMNLVHRLFLGHEEAGGSTLKTIY